MRRIESDAMKASKQVGTCGDPSARISRRCRRREGASVSRGLCCSNSTEAEEEESQKYSHDGGSTIDETERNAKKRLPSCRTLKTKTHTVAKNNRKSPQPLVAQTMRL